MAFVVDTDVGGTFTDLWVAAADGEARVFKTPTTPDVIDGVIDAMKMAAACAVALTIDPPPAHRIVLHPGCRSRITIARRAGRCSRWMSTNAARRRSTTCCSSWIGPKRRTRPVIRRRLLAVLVALVASAPAAAPAASGTKVNIGHPPAADLVPLFIAKEKGFFEKRNLDATVTRIPLASNIPPAIVAGSLQIGMGTAPILLQTHEGGLDLVAISGAARFLKENSVVGLVGRSGLSITQAADLRGKKVGVPGLNSMLHVLFQKWLLDRKVPINQVTMIELPFPQMKDLLKGGTIDAAIVIEPFRTRIVDDQTGFKIADYATEVKADILAAFWMAKSDWVSANPQALRGFREAYAEAIDYCLKHPVEAKAIETKYLGVASPVVPSYSLDVRPVDLEFFVGLGRELGMLRQPVDVTKLIAK